MARNWTPAQRSAIEARGGPILVSAAAGSGKTAVLTQRFVSLITDPVHPLDADRILVVTFTRAAAAEMKERIFSALSALSQSDPENPRWRRQRFLAERAQISTVHSFCQSLLRENFHKLSIPADFRIIDEGQSAVLRREAAGEAAEAIFEEDPETAAALAELLGNEKNDIRLEETILNLYDFIRAHPFPEKWIDSLLKQYEGKVDAAKTAWGRELLENARLTLEHAAALTEYGFTTAQMEEKLFLAYGPALEADAFTLRGMEKLAGEKRWDALKEAIAGFSLTALKPYRGDSGVKTDIQAVRAKIKKWMENLQKDFCETETEFLQDMRLTAPLIRLLFESVRRMEECYGAMKDERNALDFGDLEHGALRLLTEETEDGWRPTPCALETRERFDAVMVDEYQDTNLLQDILFQAASRDGKNLFLVGDMKQSIYSFRQAVPFLFKERKDRYVPYRKEEPVFPARIDLDQNFRSRKEVIGPVNFLFEQVMTEEVGDTAYREGEQLAFGAAHYPPERDGAHTAELCLIETDNGEELTDITEAAFIAERIRAFLQEGFTVYDTDLGAERALRPGDICILLRSVKKYTDFYINELTRRGVKAWAEPAGGFFSCYEVAVAVSLLKIIDNPMQDIPLLSVLMSPVYGFSADDAAHLRLAAGRSGSLFEGLLKRREEGDEKADSFLSQWERFREQAALEPTDMLLGRLLRVTGLSDLVQAMDHGRMRLKNLRLLIDYARSYGEYGGGTLSGFLRYLDRLEEQGGDLAAAAASEPDEDAVRIMSIHKSKGLEFPVCFLAGCGRKFGSEWGVSLAHRELGFGAKVRGEDGVRLYDTVPRRAILGRLKRESISEEMRVLYVALTRAREKLIVLGCCKNAKTALQKAAAAVSGGEYPDPFMLRDAVNLMDLILPAVLNHPAGNALRKEILLPPLPETSDFPWKVELLREKAAEAEEEKQREEKAQVDPAFLARLQKRIAYVYPYREAENLPAKIAASDIAHREGEFAGSLSRPAFLSAKGMTPAERGTALHTFMQFCDFEKARADTAQEIRRLTEMKFLTPEQAAVLSEKQIRAFFESEVARRMLRSPRILRENRFTVEIEAGEVFENTPTPCEKLILQGAFDCAFEEKGKLVLLDYKTDRVQDPRELTDLYRPQLRLYRNASRQIFGMEVSEGYLYSFHLNREIPVF